MPPSRPIDPPEPIVINDERTSPGRSGTATDRRRPPPPRAGCSSAADRRGANPNTKPSPAIRPAQCWRQHSLPWPHHFRDLDRITRPSEKQFLYPLRSVVENQVDQAANDAHDACEEQVQSLLAEFDLTSDLKRPPPMAPEKYPEIAHYLAVGPERHALNLLFQGVLTRGEIVRRQTPRIYSISNAMVSSPGLHGRVFVQGVNYPRQYLEHITHFRFGVVDAETEADAAPRPGRAAAHRCQHMRRVQ